MTWTINGVDPRTLGLIISDVSGWLDAAAASRPATTIPGRAGQRALTLAPDLAPRRLVARGIVAATSVQAARDSLDALRALFDAPSLAVSFTDAPTRAVMAALEAFTVPVAPAQMIARQLPVEITLLALDPIATDVAGTVVSATSVAAPLPLGTAPSAPVLRILGPATNPVVTYRDARGVARQTLGLTVTLAATDYVEVDAGAMTITKVASGVSTNAITLLTSGDFPIFDPLDGDRAAGAWPTLEVSAGTVEALYWRGWR